MTVLDPPEAGSAVDATDAALDFLPRARRPETSRTEWVTGNVRDQVAERRLRPGSRLPEQQICTALRVSRNTVREAMSQRPRAAS